MRSIIISLCFVLIVFLAGCQSPNILDDPTLVTNLRFSPSAFDSFRQNSDLKYTLKYPSTLSAYIIKKDSSGQEYLVKTLSENIHETKGTHSTTWLGDTNQRYFAPIGMYFGIISIEGRRYETSVQVFHF